MEYAKVAAESGSVATILKKLGYFGLGLNLVSSIAPVFAQARAENSITPIAVAVARRVASADLEIGRITASILTSPIADYGRENLLRYYGLALNLFILYVIVFGISIPVINKRVGVFSLIDSFIMSSETTQRVNFYLLVLIILGGLLWAFAYVEHINYLPFSGVFSLGKGLLSSPQAFLPFIGG